MAYSAILEVFCVVKKQFLIKNNLYNSYLAYKKNLDQVLVILVIL